MRRLIQASLFVTALACGAAFGAELPAHLAKHVTTPEDTKAITKVTEDFRSALINKDVKLLSSLMLNSSILFESPARPNTIKMVNEKFDVNFNGLNSGGLQNFSQFIAGSKDPVEEKFYNIQITQDDNVAWVMFDFEFIESGKIENHGIEVWQMMKTVDGKWKIASVFWSSKGAPK